MRIPSAAEREAYDKISKEHAKICQQARARASEAYSLSMKQADELLRDGKIDQAAHTHDG